MGLRVALLLLLLPLAATASDRAQQSFESLLSGQWQNNVGEPQNHGSSCSINRIGAFDQVQGPVPLSVSASEHPEAVKVPALNASVWEQWEFDGVAESGKGSIMMGFVRDPAFQFFGQGNLRIEFYMMLEDGTRIQQVEYVDYSTIIDCADSVSGLWNSSSRVYAFKVSKDMGSAKVWWDTGNTKGAFSLESFTSPVLASGDPWPPTEQRVPSQHPVAVHLSPGFYFNQPISGGKMTAHVQLGRKGEMKIKGYGSHTRVWATAHWLKICHGYNLVRGFLGPYAVSYLQCVSRVDDLVTYLTAQLFKNGRLLVGSRLGAVSEDADHVLFRRDFAGNLSGRFADKSTGQVLEFVSPGSGRKWRFQHTHETRWFEMSLGGGNGVTAFVDQVAGGEVGTNEDFGGRGISEHVQFPEELKKWQLWIIYGMAILGGWKRSLESFVSSVSSS